MNKNIKIYKKKTSIGESERDVSPVCMAVTHSVNEQNRFSLEKLGRQTSRAIPKRMRGKWKTTTTKSIESPGRQQREFHPGGGRRRTTQFRYKIIGTTTTQVFLHVPHNVVVVHMETFSFHIVYCIHSLQESIQYPPGGLLLYNAPTYSRRREYKS
jgi:hypothetical protein